MTEEKGFNQLDQEVQGLQTNIDKANAPTISGKVGVVNVYPPERPPIPCPVPLQKPPRTQHFVGREAELASLIRDLQPGRAVTICGPGGMGKTALALEAIWQLSPGNEPPALFPDGIIFYSFYHKPQAALAFEAIVRAYGEDPRSIPQEAAMKVLARRRSLIVLDGAEACEDLGVVLSVMGGCGVLLTTRRHSNAPGDFSDLLVLPMDKAVQLLQAWAGKLASDKDVCQEICALLGCLPLAIFLVGRYMAHRRQTGREYLTWLEKTSLAALHFGDRQHQSIFFLMDHSLTQVDNQVRFCLGVAGVLAQKPFEPEIIAVALEISPEDARKSLGELVDFGLLMRPDSSYQITHALVHAYARTIMVPKEEILAKLAKYYNNFVREKRGMGQEGYAFLDSQRDHIIAVLLACHEVELWGAVRKITWAIQEYLDLQGYWTDRVMVVQAGLNAARSDRAQYDEASFLNMLGWAYINLSEPRRAIEFYDYALKISRNIKKRVSEGNALLGLGNAYYSLSGQHRAIEFYDHALKTYQEVGDRSGEVAALTGLGNAYYDLSEQHRAIEFYDHALKISREIGKRMSEGIILGNLGFVYYDLGEPRKAIEFNEQALKIARNTGGRKSEGIRLGNLGLAYSDLGEPRKAIEFYEQALAIVQEIADRQNESEILCNLGKAYLDTEEPDRTIEYSTKSLDIARNIEYRKFEGEALRTLGRAFTAKGELQKALDHCDQALKIFKDIEYPKGEAEAFFARSHALHQLDRQEEATQCAQQALAIFQRIESPLAEKVRQQLADWGSPQEN